ncbi:AAA family ATPase [Abyssibacter profundi]|uniref:AAA family ATPase n=1 Tax=Abyssibacter profundi TaxID=2182787 RepID=A0A363UP56_9GAMM|nr:AAA family ATPase [Abyssibacter profundi]PWN57222.1 AAA family ATPase [Abyssibacter profundi]
MTPSTIAGVELLTTVQARAAEIIVGKQPQLRLAIACLIGGGHLLIDDVPGMGKTTLAHTLARLLGLRFSRVQFTSDMLPADILGVSVFEGSEAGFVFHPGPVFSEVVLADEVNRASPKTQSALLEAMEERQVTIDGTTRALPQPFFVIATQNPGEQIGTFPLPESQLDRFMMRLELGYPSAEAELELLAGRSRRALLEEMLPVAGPEQLVAVQAAVETVETREPVLRYILALIRATRASAEVRDGLSPRAGLALKRAAQAWAYMDERPYVQPEDVQAVFSAVVAHRLRSADRRPLSAEAVQGIVEHVAIP